MSDCKVNEIIKEKIEENQEVIFYFYKMYMKQAERYKSLLEELSSSVANMFDKLNEPKPDRDCGFFCEDFEKRKEHEFLKEIDRRLVGVFVGIQYNHRKSGDTFEKIEDLISDIKKGVSYG